MANDEGYRVPEVCKVVGISYRQLDYWARTELVRPSIRDAGGSGTQRLYSFEDLLQLRVVKTLLDTGISLQQIRKAIDYLKESERPLQSVTLMSDGARIYTPESPDAVIDLISRGQGVFAIALDKVRDDLSNSLAKGARQKPKRATAEKPERLARAGGA
jgi:DNA-binding transcriptional MerR regulator